MPRTVVLDTGPLGLVTHPKAEKENTEAAKWLRGLLVGGASVLIPEICDYELRRELVRAGKTKSVEVLDRYKSQLRYVPLTTSVMLRAANFWAVARQRGEPTAPDPALDGDVILAAQTAELADTEKIDVVIATTNVGHLSRFVAAEHWQDVSP